jgi:4-amino-4-deoxy-L-arabinose transferase-like glycosyltransferase
MGVSGGGAERGSRRSGTKVPSPKIPSEEQLQIRRFWLRLLVIGAVALALRLVSLAELHGSPLFEVLLGDAKQYDVWAQQIADGRGLGTTAFYQTPVYSYLMGFVVKITGHSVLVIRLLQGIIGAASCVLLGLAGRRFFNERTGLVAAFLLAVYPPAIFFDALIQKSSLDGLFVTSILAALGACVARPRLRWLVALGVAMGALMLNRENARALYPIVIVWLLFVLRGTPIRTRLGWRALSPPPAR